MKPNPLIAAIFMIILLLTLVVMLRAAIGAPHTEEDAPHGAVEVYEEATGKGAGNAPQTGGTDKDSTVSEEEPAH